MKITRPIIPHTGFISGSSYSHERVGGVEVTKLKLELEPGTSTFAVTKR